MKDNGQLRITADELAEFVASPSPSCWWIDASTGETSVTRGQYAGTSPEGLSLMMCGPDPVWVFQWVGDWQRACDEQLNPLLAAAFPGGAS